MQPKLGRCGGAGHADIEPESPRRCRGSSVCACSIAPRASCLLTEAGKTLYRHCEALIAEAAVHAVFPSRRGMVPAVRSLLDPGSNTSSPPVRPSLAFRGDVSPSVSRRRCLPAKALQILFRDLEERSRSG